MIQSFPQYVERVLRTESGAPPIDHEMPIALQWRSATPTIYARLQHAVMGLVTEVGELVRPTVDLAEHFRVCGSFDPDCEGAYDDWKNMREEIGDLWWYTALLCHVLNVDTEGTPMDCPDGSKANDEARAATPLTLPEQQHAMIATVGGLMDVLKRVRYYRFDESVFEPKELRKLVGGAVVWLGQMILFTEHFFGAYDDNPARALTAIWSENIAKLQARYPEKFTTDAAFNRDLAAEAAAVERT